MVDPFSREVSKNFSFFFGGGGGADREVQFSLTTSGAMYVYGSFC